MTPTRPVVVRRVMPAPPHVVYAEWIDPVALADFMGPAPTRATVPECDPRPGGRLHIVMSDGVETVNIRGEYLELDPPHRLSFSWHSDMDGGFASTVTVTFDPHGEHETLMTIEHAPVPSALADDHEEGWGQIATQLAGRVQRG